MGDSNLGGACVDQRRQESIHRGESNLGGACVGHRTFCQRVHAVLDHGGLRRALRAFWANLHTPPPQKLRLDIGCGFNKQPGFIGMDRRKVDGVEIVHDAENVPYPLPNGCCVVILMSHLIEHIAPQKTIEVMDECWRLLEPGGILMITTPYATSFGYFQDPTHCNPWNEATPAYFDPEHPSGLYNIYKPKPWKVAKLFWSQTGNIELVMEKRDG